MKQQNETYFLLHVVPTYKTYDDSWIAYKMDEKFPFDGCIMLN